MDGLIMGINPCVSGMNYHDPSVCLLDSGRIIFAIEEERLNRKRHSSGLFPALAVEECKLIAEQLKLPITDIAVGFEPSLSQRRNMGEPGLLDARTRMAVLLRRISGLHNAKVSFYPHHKAHAASAANVTETEQAMCVVFDGTGELSAASVWVAKDDSFTLIDSVDMPNSLGYFYAAATAYLGFQPWGEEGKLMALAPYGNPDSTIMNHLTRFFNLSDDNSYDVSTLIGPCLCDGFALDIEKAVSSFEQLFQQPRRLPGVQLSLWHRNFAFCIQDTIEKVVLSYIKKWQQRIKPSWICCSGGLFMNCKMNGFLRERLAPTGFSVQPVAGDAGTAIGAAVLCAQEKAKKRIVINLEELSLGIAYSEKQVEDVLRSSGVKYYRSADIAEECARFIYNGNIVAWFQGKSELGCRALGHRSILAAPTPHEMSDVINSRVKHREEWRPFACSMLEDFAPVILEGYPMDNRPAYMIEAYPVVARWHSCMEAVMHSADNTTRPQVVRKEGVNELYYDMLKHYFTLSGFPMVLNTSLNDKGQPIIQTPQEAIAFFLDHRIDYLIIDHFVVHKNEND